MIRPRTLLAIGLFGAASLGLGAATLSIIRSNTPDASPVAASVAATASEPLRIGALGTVEPPGGVVAIAPPAAGLVTAVLVAPGQMVEENAVLFRLDDRLPRVRLAQARQAVASAEAALAQAEGTLPALRATVAVAESAVAAAIAQRDEAASELVASEQLASRNAIARRELERKQTALLTASAQLAQAEASRDQAAAQRDQFDPERAGTSLLPLRAAVDDARAALVFAETELAITEIRAPVAGRVLTVTTRAGQYAAVGGSGDPLVTLAPAGPLQVRAEVEEADLPLLVDGLAATGYPRGAGPDAGVPLTFLRREPLLKPKTTLAGGTAERIDTRVIEVVFEVTRDDAGLVPGQLLDVLIDTAP